MHLYSKYINVSKYLLNILYLIISIVVCVYTSGGSDELCFNGCYNPC